MVGRKAIRSTDDREAFRAAVDQTYDELDNIRAWQRAGEAGVSAMPDGDYQDMGGATKVASDGAASDTDRAREISKLKARAWVRS